MKTYKVLAICLVAAFAACGDDDGGSGVDGSKAVNELTMDEMKAICVSTVTKINSESVEMTCLAAGLAAKSMGQDCEQVKSTCISETNKSFSADAECSVTQADVDALKDCSSVTVGEYEKCINEMTGALQSQIGAFSCSTDPADLENFQPDFTSPASCTALEGKCEGLEIPSFSDDVPA